MGAGAARAVTGVDAMAVDVEADVEADAEAGTGAEDEATTDPGRRRTIVTRGRAVGAAGTVDGGQEIISARGVIWVLALDADVFMPGGFVEGGGVGLGG